MTNNLPVAISNFHIAGINYKKTDAAIRGQFAINSNQYENILGHAPGFNIHSLFIISTCNRTEIYGFADHAEQLIALLCSQTTGDQQTFKNLAYVKSGGDAIEHLFEVGAGLDSQILGDYEITGQLKNAVKFSKEHGFINCFLERLVNSVLQSSKIIRNETALSSGTVSVAYAAIEYIKTHTDTYHDKKILVIGTGKIGRNTCKNLVDYLGAKNITLINRSEEKAIAIAESLGLKYAPINCLDEVAAAADIILVATSAPLPVLLKTQLEHHGDKLIIDLSVPCNVEPAAAQLPGITLINVDELSKVKDETFNKRKAEIPMAKTIIAEQLSLFTEWCELRKNAPSLNAAKSKLSEIYFHHLSGVKGDAGKCPVMMAEKKIQKAINDMAGKMRIQNQRGCNFLEAINDFVFSME